MKLTKKTNTNTKRLGDLTPRQVFIHQGKAYTKLKLIRQDKEPYIAVLELGSSDQMYIHSDCEVTPIEITEIIYETK